MTSEKAKQLVADISRRTTEGRLRWSAAPGETLVAALGGKLRLSYNLRYDYLTVSAGGGESEDLMISADSPLEHVDLDRQAVVLDTELVVPELRDLRAEIERTFQRNVEQRVDEFLAILGKS